MKMCLQCGKEFDPVNERPSHPAKFCSRACSASSQRTRVELVCRQCGRKFQRKAYMATWSQNRGPFCGFRCYGIWQSKNIIGESNPNFVPGSEKRGAGQWMRNRLLALERDGWKCIRCGKQNRLHVDHVIPWREGQPNPHALDNLQTLCASCHRKKHPAPQGPNGKFLPIR